MERDLAPYCTKWYMAARSEAIMALTRIHVVVTPKYGVWIMRIEHLAQAAMQGSCGCTLKFG